MGFSTISSNPKDIWEYVTRKLTNLDDVRAAKIDNLDMLVSRAGKLTQLSTLKALFFKRAETLGTDGGDTGYSVTHAQTASGEPLYTRVFAGTASGYKAYSYGQHNIARNLRMPEGGVGGRLVFECRARLETTSLCELYVGLSHGNSGEATYPSADIFYNSGISANWQARSYQTAEQQTDTGVAADTSWHVFRIEITGSGVMFYVDGVLKATYTSQIPDAGLVDYTKYARVTAVSKGAGAIYARYEYVAVWNEAV
jgi:hypothetical protein